MKVLLCFGTRPEWLKIKPLLKVLDNYELLFTGQHPDLIKDIKTDYKVHIYACHGDKRLDQIISDCLTQFQMEALMLFWCRGTQLQLLLVLWPLFTERKKFII